MKRARAAIWWLCACVGAQAANITITPWTSVYKGVELASGFQEPTQSGETLQRTFCLRIDLSDPDIELFTTPRCTNACSGWEARAENTSHFLEYYGLQAAVNCNWYSSSSGGGSPPFGGLEDVTGLAISQGTLVSPSESSRPAVLMFTTNNVPIFIRSDIPATNTAGIYTAAAGDRALLVDGINQYPTPNPSDNSDPRTALGISADKRHLFLMVLDGRQDPDRTGTRWSYGGDFHSTAEWLKRFGAHDAINVDGGGSTTMSRSDCLGKAIRVNHSSFVNTYGEERNVGHNFGVYAKPLPTDIKELDVQPGTSTAILTWRTDFPATTQVEYGLTTNYGNATPLDSRLVKKHVATISGLTTGAEYHFRVKSTGVAGEQTFSCRLLTTNSLTSSLLVPLTNSWRYTNANMDGTEWKSPSYNHSGWGAGQALLYVHENSSAVSPRRTLMPPSSSRTYYFRTTFSYTGETAGVSLLLSNYVDDGAVFYLNGQELARLRMPAGPIVNNTAPTNRPCAGFPQFGDAASNCPDVFLVSGNPVSNLVAGLNTLAVEVHNSSTTTTTTGDDLVFGSAIFKQASSQLIPHIFLSVEDNVLTLYWNGEGFTLQRSTVLSSAANWEDVPGPVTASPHVLNDTQGGNRFYRLRK